MRRLVYIAVIAAEILCFVEAASAGILYAVSENTNTLVSIDSNTLTYSIVGNLGVAFDFGGMDYDANSNILYMIDGRGSRGLYTVNRTTGAATLVGIHGVNDLFGLAYDSQNNVLYGSRFSGGTGVYSLNVATGAATFVGDPGIHLGGLAYDSDNDRLIGIQDGAGILFTINRSTGAATFLANPGSNNDSGLAYDADANLFWDIDWNGNLYSINPAAGFTRTLRLSGLGPHDGLAYVSTAAPVPEPATFAMFGVGALGLVGAALRRRMRAA